MKINLLYFGIFLNQKKINEEINYKILNYFVFKKRSSQ